MRTLLLLHVVAGSLGLASGYIALSAKKGGSLHRTVGTLFVWAMLAMSLTGLFVSLSRNVEPSINVPSALIALYLTVTALLTMKPEGRWTRLVAVFSALTGAGIALLCAVLAVTSIARGGAGAGLAYPLAVFGGVALVAAAGDRRVAREGAIRGAPRLRRHLWRMCFALFVASIAFYLGPDRLPRALQSPALRASGVLVPPLAAGLWLWRIRRPRTPALSTADNALELDS